MSLIIYVCVICKYQKKSENRFLIYLKCVSSSPLSPRTLLFSCVLNLTPDTVLHFVMHSGSFGICRGRETTFNTSV